MREGTYGRKGARVAAPRRPALNPRSGRLDYADARGARAFGGVPVRTGGGPRAVKGGEKPDQGAAQNTATAAVWVRWS